MTAAPRLLWPLPREFEGKTVAVIATGPSLTQEDCDAVSDSGIPTIVISDAHILCPWAEVLYSADKKWWDWHAEKISFDGLKLIGEKGGSKIAPFLQEIMLDPGQQNGFEPDPSQPIRKGSNSGFQGIGVAAHMGASKIVLLGFDMKAESGRPTHFFGWHPNECNGKCGPSPDRYERWVQLFDGLATGAEQSGVKIVNCSRKTAITAFERMTIDDFIATL